MLHTKGKLRDITGNYAWPPSEADLVMLQRRLMNAGNMKTAIKYALDSCIPTEANGLWLIGGSVLAELRTSMEGFLNCDRDPSSE